MTPRANLWRSIIGVCLLAAAAVVCAALAANLANGGEAEANQQKDDRTRHFPNVAFPTRTCFQTWRNEMKTQETTK